MHPPHDTKQDTAINTNPLLPEDKTGYLSNQHIIFVQELSFLHTLIFTHTEKHQYSE